MKEIDWTYWTDSFIARLAPKPQNSMLGHGAQAVVIGEKGSRIRKNKQHWQLSSILLHHGSAQLRVTVSDGTSSGTRPNGNAARFPDPGGQVGP